MSSKLEVARVAAEGRLSLRDVSLETGPRIFRISGKHELPQLIWHNQVIWRIISTSYSGKEMTIKVAGVPDSLGALILYSADKGEPARVHGGEIVSYHELSHLAEIKINVPKEAAGEVRIFMQ